MTKGSPEQLQAALEAKIAELQGTDIDSSIKIKLRDKESIVEGEDPMDDAYTQGDEVCCATEPVFGYDDDDEFISNYDQDTVFVVEDPSMGVVGDHLSYADLQSMFISWSGDPVVDEYNGDFELWLQDTVNSGYLSVLEPWEVEGATNTCNISGKPVFGYDDDDEFVSDWVELDSKSVQDSDGFWTDYTLYRYDGDPSDVEYPYLCMFGDKEMNEPDEGYADWSGETEEEARDWFENYHGFESDDDIGYTTDAPIKSSINCDIDLAEYDYIGNQNGYQLYRKIVNGKGQWAAQDQDEIEPPFAITYDQARGYEPIIRTDIEKLRYDLGKKLFGNTDVDNERSCTAVNASTMSLNEDEIDQLYEIAERYNTSDPVSGDWATEYLHEQQAIADEFGISLDEAKQLMVDYLGFDYDEFDEPAPVRAAYDTNTTSEWWYNYKHPDVDGYWYYTTHGVQPGSVPTGPGAQVLEIRDVPGGAAYFKFNKLLKPEALKYFDIKERAPKN